MEMIVEVPLAIVLSTVPRQIIRKDLLRIGQIMQNQESAAIIYVRPGGDGTPRSYLRLNPGGVLLRDYFTPNSEIWAYSDISGAILTVVEKYKVAA